MAAKRCQTAAKSVDSILPHADPFDVLALWSRADRGTAAHRKRAASRNPLEQLAQRVASSAELSTVVLRALAALPGPHAALLPRQEALNRIVKRVVNRTTRAAASRSAAVTVRSPRARRRRGSRALRAAHALSMHTPA